MRDRRALARRLPLPRCLAGRVASISLDDDEMIAVDSAGRVLTGPRRLERRRDRVEWLGRRRLRPSARDESDGDDTEPGRPTLPDERLRSTRLPPAPAGARTETFPASAKSDGRRAQILDQPPPGVSVRSLDGVIAFC
jgi:hypothetical protein